MKRNYSRVIEELRTIHGLNLVAIGQRIGIDPRTVGKWQAGKHKPNKDSRKKINALYREVRKDMTTQVSIFEDDNKQIMEVVTRTEFHGHPLDIYGSEEEPWFKARDIAEMIDYSVASLNKFVQSVDEDEKARKIVPTLGGNQSMWFLTEQGLYEVLFQSRKPIAKEFKKWVKQILKEIRHQGYYMAGELVEEHEPAPQALPTLEQAENNYIDTLAKAIQESSTRADKMELIERLNKFVSGL